MVITGIDYSITSPAICIHVGETWEYSNCIFHFLSNRKKYSDVFSNRFFGKSFEEYNSEEQRYDSISSWAVDKCDFSDQIAIENYAFNATGRVFNIAENTGVLKYKLFQKGIPLETIPPSTVKKLATGKGNASKDAMYEAFVVETGVQLMDELMMKTLNNPVTDIVDSYYVCKTLFNMINNTEN
tara:strand:+ start:1531 stop:2082 length:552 start_codon:yes stop_codon:yes gene_type:complete